MAANMAMHFEAKFEDENVATQLIAVWTDLEQQMLTQQMLTPQEEVPPAVRYVAVRLLAELSELLAAPYKTYKIYFEAVSLLDAMLVLSPGSLSISSLPSMCVALINLLQKMDHRTEAISGFWKMVSEKLRVSGFVMDEQHEGKVIRENELLILTALDWRLNVPNFFSWVTFLCARLNIVSQSTLKKEIKWIEMTTLRKLTTIVALHRPTLDLPSRVLAIGLLCLVVISAGLLPLEALRPEDLTPAQWTELFIQSQTAPAPPTCNFLGHQGVLLVLQIAASVGIGEMKTASRTVAATMLDATCSNSR